MLHRELDKKSAYENRYKYSLPSADERRIVAKANEQCFYYLAGISKCAEKTALRSLKQSSDDESNFYDCKPVTEAYYRCVTKDAYGTQLEAMEQEVRPYFKNFAKCMIQRPQVDRRVQEVPRRHTEALRAAGGQQAERHLLII